MRDPTYFDRPPWQCRRGWHSWETDPVGTKRCRREHCVSMRPLPQLAEVVREALAAVADDVPLGDDLWVTCTRHDGLIIYEGPVPIPAGLDRLSPENLAARRLNRYEFSYLDLDQQEETDVEGLTSSGDL